MGGDGSGIAIEVQPSARAGQCRSHSSKSVTLIPAQAPCFPPIAEKFIVFAKSFRDTLRKKQQTTNHKTPERDPHNATERPRNLSIRHVPPRTAACRHQRRI